MDISRQQDHGGREGGSSTCTFQSPPHAAVSIQGDKNECWNDVQRIIPYIEMTNETIDSTTYRSSIFLHTVYIHRNAWLVDLILSRLEVLGRYGTVDAPSTSGIRSDPYILYVHITRRPQRHSQIEKRNIFHKLLL